MRLTSFTVVVGTAEEASAVLDALEEQKNCTVEYDMDKRAAQMQTVSHERFDYEFTVRPYDQTTPQDLQLVYKEVLHALEAFE